MWERAALIPGLCLMRGAVEWDEKANFLGAVPEYGLQTG